MRAHHERWDGGGYPDGVAGERIPVEARIISVADTFDAITTTRPYRPADHHERALGVIAGEAGRQLDPDRRSRVHQLLHRPARDRRVGGDRRVPRSSRPPHTAGELATARHRAPVAAGRGRRRRGRRGTA